jgi:hypothetical protein
LTSTQSLTELPKAKDQISGGGQDDHSSDVSALRRLNNAASSGRVSSPVLTKRSVYARLDNSTKEEYHVQVASNDHDNVILTLKSAKPESVSGGSPRSFMEQSREPRHLRWSVQSSTQISAAERRHFSPGTREIGIFEPPERKHFEGAEMPSPKKAQKQSDVDVHVLTTAESMIQRSPMRHRHNTQEEQRVRAREIVAQKTKSNVHQRWR